MQMYMFQTVCLSIIRSLFTVRSAMVYVIQVCRQLSSRTRMELILFCCWWVPTSNRIKPFPSWSCSKAVYKPVWHTPLLSVQWINSWWFCCWWVPTSNRIKLVPSWSCMTDVYKPVWHTPLLSVQWINSRWWKRQTVRNMYSFMPK